MPSHSRRYGIVELAQLCAYILSILSGYIFATIFIFLFEPCDKNNNSTATKSKGKYALPNAHPLHVVPRTHDKYLLYACHTLCIIIIISRCHPPALPSPNTAFSMYLDGECRIFIFRSHRMLLFNVCMSNGWEWGQRMRAEITL